MISNLALLLVGRYPSDGSSSIAVKGFFRAMPEKMSAMTCLLYFLLLGILGSAEIVMR